VQHEHTHDVRVLGGCEPPAPLRLREQTWDLDASDVLCRAGDARRRGFRRRCLAREFHLPRRLPSPDLRRAERLPRARPASTTAGLERWILRARTPSIDSLPGLSARPGRARSLFVRYRFPRTRCRVASASSLRPRPEPSAALSRPAGACLAACSDAHENDASHRSLQDRPLSTSTRLNRPISSARTSEERAALDGASPASASLPRSPRRGPEPPPVARARLAVVVKGRAAWTNRTLSGPQAALHRHGVVSRPGGEKNCL